MFQKNIHFVLTLFIKFKLRIGSIDNWYISQYIAIDLMINTLPSVDRASRSIYLDMLLFCLSSLDN